MLILSDVNGIPIACSESISGNHNDTFGFVENFDDMAESLQKSEICIDGLFLNSDTGFDTSSFRDSLFRHDVIDTIDNNKRNGAFKAILIRFEAKKSHWKALHIIAFCIILLRQL